MVRLVFWCIVVGSAALLPGCSGAGSDSQRSDDPQADDAPIDLAQFPSDPETARRVLGMRWSSVAQRLGSASLKTKSHFVFTRGNTEYEQDDTSTITQEASGNFYVSLDTEKSSAEFYQIGTDAYVRQDAGHLRKKARTEVTNNVWTDVAWSGIYHSMAPFRGHLSFEGPQSATLQERSVQKFKLVFSAEASESPVIPETPLYALPHGPASRWREVAKPTGAKGELWVDTATGVILKYVLDGRFDVADREQRSTQVALRFEATLSDIGNVKTLRVPESVDEYKRTPAPNDPIAFFRKDLEELNPPADATTPANKKTKTP